MIIREEIDKSFEPSKSTEFVLITHDWAIEKISVIARMDPEEYLRWCPTSPIELPALFVEKFSVVYDIKKERFLRNELKIPKAYIERLASLGVIALGPLLLK